MRPRWVGCVVGFIAALLVARGASAHTYYVHAERGRDTRSASEAQQPEKPWRTLGRVARELADGDTVYGAGTFDDRLVRYDALRDIRIEQWPGESPFVVRGSRAVPPAAWSHHMGDCYRAAIDGAPDIRGVVVLFGAPERRDDFGRHRGWLRMEASPEACAASAYSYHWDGKGGLYINAGGADPATDPEYSCFPVEYALGGLPPAEGLIELLSLTNSVISGVTFRTVIHKADGAYLLGIAGTGNVVQSCVFEHCSWHALVVGRFSSVCSGNTVRGCIFRGFGDSTGTAGPNLLTFYSGITNVEGNVEEENTYLCYGMLGYDGAPLDPAFEVNGTYCHTGGHGLTVRDHERRKLVVRHFENPGWAMDCANAAPEMPQAGREWVPEAYEIRHTDCIVHGGYTAAGIANGSFLRCAFYMDNFGPRGGYKGCFGFGPVRLKCLFDACHISVNMYNSAQPTSVFLMSRSAPEIRPHLLLRNTNIIARRGPLGVEQRVFWWAVGAQWGQVSARGCVFASLGPRDFVLADGMADARISTLDLQGCYYYKVGQESWVRGHPLASTREQYEANVDPPIEAGGDAVYDIDPGLVGNGPEPAPGGGLATRVHFQANAPRLGINGLEYAGHYGAWQLEGCDADFNRDARVGSEDAFEFLFAFGVGHISADMDGNGVITSEDLIWFLSAFFGGCG